jgi:hypothetical protein
MIWHLRPPQWIFEYHIRTGLGLITPASDIVAGPVFGGARRTMRGCMATGVDLHIVQILCNYNVGI